MNSQFDGIPERFHVLYHQSKIERECFWLGQRMYKTPHDLFVFQEVIWETRPTIIIETGTWRGGSALFMATVLDAIGGGRVISIDTNALEKPEHPRISYIEGSSLDPQVHDVLRMACEGDSRVMVVLDSLHTYGHVLEELKALAPLVTRGCYLVVEDTALNGHPIEPDFGPGPMEAVLEFLSTHDGEFVVDESRNKYLWTYHPGGFMRRL